MLLDQVNFETVERCISPVTQTNADTAIVSQIIDLQAKNGITFYAAFGTISDADVTVALKLEESADSGMAGAVDCTSDATKIIGTVPTGVRYDTDDTVYQFGYKGGLRYLRLTITPTGNNAGSLPVSVVAVSRNKKLGSGPTGS